MLMLSVVRAVAESSIGSLRAGAFGGMVIALWPPKVTVRSVRGTMAPPALVMARCTESSVTGTAPYSLVRRRRKVRPPALMWTIWRTVWSLKMRAVPPVTGSIGCCGEAPQVSTQVWAGGAAAASSSARAIGAATTPPNTTSVRKGAADRTLVFTMFLSRIFF